MKRLLYIDSCVLREASRTKRIADALVEHLLSTGEIVIAAPFWEGAYPALLKVYFEHISVVGIVNRYTDHGPVGMCRASKLHYVTTRGGFTTDEQDLGWQNVKGLAKVYGIEHADCISVNAIDVPTTDVDAAVAAAIAGIPQLFGE